jgi:hypothetical protein
VSLWWSIWRAGERVDRSRGAEGWEERRCGRSADGSTEWIKKEMNGPGGWGRAKVGLSKEE